MRAIDGDALLDEVMERHCKECDKRKGIKNGKYRIIYEIGDAPCRACDVDDVKDELEDAPTIEPERKKGKWIDRGWSGDGRGNSWHEWECSECKHITKGAKWDFCPKCGADNREDGSANADANT